MDYNWHITGRTATNFLAMCKEAAEGDLFKTFKQDPRCQAILEHCSNSVALRYYGQVQRENPDLLGHPELFENDNYGTPTIQDLLGLHCSNSTMQYIGVLSNLIKYFGSLDGMNIIEIGGGYGGQAMVVQNYRRGGTYMITDLPKVTLLQKRYLSKHSVNFGMPPPYDLLISNYALSEVTEPQYSWYVKNVVCKARHGYVTCNMGIDLTGWPEHWRYDDISGEAPGNFILVW